MSVDQHEVGGAVGRILAVAGRRTRAGKGWLIRCPAHDDRTASLSVSEGAGGRALLRCHAGCTIGAIVEALGLAMSDLFDAADESSARASTARDALTLAEFAVHTALPVDALAFYGLRDAIRYGHACVEFDYRRRDGSHARTRQRIGLTGKRFAWKGESGSIIAYEPDLGELARAQGYVVLVEGESDTLTLLYAGFPAIGIPGADATHTLQAEHVAGLKHVFYVVEPDHGGRTFGEKVPARLRELKFTGGVHALKMPAAAKDPSALFKRDPDGFAEVFRAMAREILEPPPSPLATAWRTLRDLGGLREAPPPRRWLLQRVDDESNGMANPLGVLPMGKVGLFIAAGGAGKTFALVGLALCVATGRRWLDHFIVATRGRVLLALGEEDPEEVRRRFYSVARAMRLTDEQVQQAEADIVPLALAGVPVPLVENDGRTTVATETLAELRRLLAQQEWRLIILDPLSRFAGADTEKDNAAATRFIQAVESLIEAPGSPTVLISHHTNKLARGGTGVRASASNARGSSAITDGARWAAELESYGDEGARLTITKSNYGMRGAPLELVRDAGHDGYLRAATAEERRAAAGAEAEREREYNARVDAEVLAALRAKPGRSATALKEDPNVPVRHQDIGRACRRLVQEKKLRKVGHGYEPTEEG